MDVKTSIELEKIKQEISLADWSSFPKVHESAQEMEWDGEGKMFVYHLKYPERPRTLYFWKWKTASGSEMGCVFSRPTDQQPSETELELGRAICFIEEQAKIRPMFTCKDCGKVTHWTDIYVDPLNVKHPLLVKYALYQKERCGCGEVPYPEGS